MGLTPSGGVADRIAALSKLPYRESTEVELELVVRGSTVPVRSG